MRKTDYITKGYFDTFEKRLDKKFEELLISIAKGFTEVDKKFIEQEKNLKEYMDDKFATKVDLYETEVRINTRFDSLDTKIVKIEGHIGAMEVRSTHLDGVITHDHGPRIKNLEAKVGL